MSRPKSLSERLQWMAENLPGFADELASVEHSCLASAGEERIDVPTVLSKSHEFAFQILCAAEVIAQGGSDDFLVCVQMARDNERECVRRLVGVCVKVQLFYPFGTLVPATDVSASLAALDALAHGTECGCPTGPSVGQVVAHRRSIAAQNSPARSRSARTAEIWDAMSAHADGTPPRAGHLEGNREIN